MSEATKIIPVILSGGSGTRLWPLSRKHHPKQYLTLAGSNTMLQETILRLNGLENLENPIIVCNVEHRFLVAEQCKKINILKPTILLEPVGKNTAPAILAAALHVAKKSTKAILLVLSADHVIQDISAFHEAIKVALSHSLEGKLATFGIVLTHPDTGYGYIKSSQKNINGAYKVEEFVEKPDLKTAKKYFAQDNYLWNSGMFMFQAGQFIDELTIYSPEIRESVQLAVNNATHDLDFIRLEQKAFESSPSNSIDYALMEKSQNAVVVPLNAKWSDIGSWSALYDIGKKDKNSNVIYGDVFTEETTNSFIDARHHMVAIIGVDDLIVVDTPNATLISSKRKAYKVKKIVERLQEEKREEESSHRKVYRPWGWYDSIEIGVHFQVKRLHVYPNEKLSLQLHHKRAEHWVVVSGVATVTIGVDIFKLKEGQSAYIPIGIKHALENLSFNLLEIIEVQSGTYLGEDDIVRFEDIYGRVDEKN